MGQSHIGHPLAWALQQDAVHRAPAEITKLDLIGGTVGMWTLGAMVRHVW